MSVSEELDQFRVQGEAVVLGFPGLVGYLTKRNHLTTSGGYSFLIVKGNGATGPEEEEEAEEKRVLQREQNLWLLPARLSDSGEYTCIYRWLTYTIPALRYSYLLMVLSLAGHGYLNKTEM